MVEKEIMMEIYRVTANKFYDDSLSIDRPLPYNKEVFVETVTRGYQLILENTEFAFSEVEDSVTKNINTNLSDSEIRNEVNKIMRGEGIGKNLFWRWVNYCWAYIKDINNDIWNDYCIKVSKRDNIARTRRPMVFHDFIYLLLTIEYISISGCTK